MGHFTIRFRRLALACGVAGTAVLLASQPGATQVRAAVAIPEACLSQRAGTLTDQCWQAFEVVKRDTYVKGLLAGHRFTIASAHSPDDSGGPVWTLKLRLPTPLSVAKTTLPGTFEPPGPGSYLLRPSPPVAINRATTLTLVVDVGLGYVTRVTPPRGAVKGLVAGAGAIPITTFGVEMDHLAAGSDGSIWGTWSKQIIRLTPGGTTKGFAIPSGGAAGALTAGPDGNLWFTEFSANKIGRISLDGTIAEFPVPTENGGPASIVAGPDGNVWFAEVGNKPRFAGMTDPDLHRIGRITPDGTITEFPLPGTGMHANAMATGSDGNLWFALLSSAGGYTIGRMTPAGAVTQFQLPNPKTALEEITRGPDGNIWFTEFSLSAPNKIGRITPQGAITEFVVPERATKTTFRPFPNAIVSGPDGNLWFEVAGSNQVGRITVQGKVTLFEAPASTRASFAVTGSDSSLWFPLVHEVAKVKLTPATQPAK